VAVFFCTYCSKDKRHDDGVLPAIERYQSGRIARVSAAAHDLGLGFLILSGKFGLIGPEQPIPDYDQRLVADEVSNVSALAAGQLQARGASHVVYFTVSTADDPDVAPYRDAIVAATAGCSIPLSVIEIVDVDE
jgi:hypothetical protein